MALLWPCGQQLCGNRLHCSDTNNVTAKGHSRASFPAHTSSRASPSPVLRGARPIRMPTRPRVSATEQP